MAPKSAGSVGSYGKSSEGSSVNGSETSIGVIRGDDGSGDLLSRGNGSRKVKSRGLGRQGRKPCWQSSCRHVAYHYCATLSFESSSL